ncbi:MAG: bifunctional 4-hydroxy-3-methylbut-2-enyl diphosphate reductase/30S ribosomal protein S1 [Oscillospiraceae bacterium]
MKIEIAKNAGFCFGVTRAVTLAQDAAKQYGRVYTLGELIHNELAVADLEKCGVYAVESAQTCAGKPLIIRSHGVPRSVEEEARRLCSSVIDATCPFVKKIHKIAGSLPEEARLIVLGDKAHPEVIGIVGNASCKAFVCKDFEEIKALFDGGELSASDRIALVVQTTFDRSRFLKCSERVQTELGCVEIYDTVCNATSERQQAAEELAKRAALMIVVGGRSSSNTRKLAEICGRCCETVFVTQASEIPRQIFQKAENLRADNVIIGITAGASTPAYTIKEVHKKMNKEITNNIENEEDFASLLEQDQSFNRLYTGKRVKATVVSVSNKEVVVEVGAKQTGYITREELSNDVDADVESIVKPGDVIDAVVIKVDDSMGTAMLSKKRVDVTLALDKLEAIRESGETLEGTVTQIVKGGVIIVYDNARVFIPASHTGVPRGGKLEDLKGKQVKFKVIEVSGDRGGRVVGSIRQAMREVRDAQRAAFWETVEVGQKFEGEVRSIESYGVFVDIGPIDGLVHTADLTWNRIGHPKDVVSVGDKISVVVKSFDPEKKRVSLSAKDPEDNPWTKFVAEYHKDDVIKATVVSITEFGAFAQIIPGVDGLIHISQVAAEPVQDINTVLKVGQVVDVKIIEINEEKNRVSLSIRALAENSEE